MIKKITLGMASLGVMAVMANAQVASDNAGNYGGGWTNATNGGTGFTPWDLTQNNAGAGIFAGYFIGDSSTGLGGNTSLNNPTGDSFGVFANPSTAFANANRGFAEGALTTGQTFSLQLGVNFRNGNKGLTLTSGGTELFDFNVGGDAYTYSENGGAGTALTLAYEPDSIFTLAFTQEAGNNIALSISRTTTELGTESVLNTTFNGTAGSIDGFKLYNSGTSGGADGDADNLYFNNLSVSAAPVPEPATVLLVGPALLGGLFFARRRRA